jgi:hypothetical protein
MAVAPAELAHSSFTLGSRADRYEVGSDTSSGSWRPLRCGADPRGAVGHASEGQKQMERLATMTNQTKFRIWFAALVFPGLL